MRGFKICKNDGTKQWLKHGYSVQYAIPKREYEYGKIQFLKTSRCIVPNASMKHWSPHDNWIYLLSKGQTHRRRADNTQGLIPCGYRFFYPIHNDSLPRPTGKEKNRCRAGCFRALNIHIPAAVLKNQDRRSFWPISYRISAAARRRMPPCSFAPVFGNQTA